ncbi:MAG TPA: OmpA family protein [Stellaceae bacterium]|nr:OmpA family protein [Stellaceae bacterium]
MKFRHACVMGAALGLVTWSAAQAQVMTDQPDGYYFRLEGGWNHLDDFNGTGSTSSLTFDSSTDEGYILGGAAGYKWGPYHVELEMDQRDNSVRSIHIGNPGDFGAGLAGASSSPGGGVEAFSVLLNGVYDLPWHPIDRLTPYVGLGIGAVGVKLRGFNVSGTNLVTDSDLVFALQPSVGLRYQVSDNIGIGLEYRFLNGFDPSFKDNTGHRFGTSDYQSHSVLLSLTYAFAAPPAPPPPAPMPAAAQAAAPEAAPAPEQREVFLVFFDFNKSTITPAGRKVVAAAAEAFKAGHRTRLDATGYTDLAGTKAYNLRLSQRRAVAVRKLLIADGVPASEITTAWKGEQDPRVPTPNGVREPQNRRVEIVMP